MLQYFLYNQSFPRLTLLTAFRIFLGPEFTVDAGFAAAAPEAL